MYQEGFRFRNSLSALIAKARRTVGKKGENIPIMENYSLCRCGKSSYKPFCDGKHLG